MSQKKLERLAGAIIVVSVVLGLFFVYWSAQNRKLHGYHLSARFENIGMLQVGDPVQLGGVTVGHVQTVDIDPEDYYATLSLWIREDVRLPIETSVSVRTTSLAGGNYVKISPGEADRLLPPRSEIIKTDGVIDIAALLKEVLQLAVMGPEDK